MLRSITSRLRKVVGRAREGAMVAVPSAPDNASSQLSYVEVSNAQHFDAFLPFSGFDSRFVPLHAYFTQAMNAMYAKLTTKTALPGSQVVRTTARGGNPGAAPALTALNVPPIAATPAAADAIGFTGTAINVPQ